MGASQRVTLLEFLFFFTYSNIDIEANKNSQNKKEAPKESFFQSFFSSLFGNSNPEADKKRKLRNIAKAISKSKYKSFYKPSTVEMQAPFGKFIYDIYKTIAPAQIMFKNLPNPSIFTRHIINYILSDNQRKIEEQLDEQKILEVSRKLPMKELKKQVELKLQEFINEFNDEKALCAENLSKSFTLFKAFCTFDYYLIIRKFDSSYREFNFNTTPRLEKINAEYVLNDLKDFMEIAYAMTDNSINWQTLFAMIKSSQQKEVISYNNWKKILEKIKSIQASRSLDLIVQHIGQETGYSTKPISDFRSVLEPYIENFENETKALLQKIESEQKENKASNLSVQIFGASDTQNLKYYIPSFNAVLEKKNLEVIVYAEPLNYLKTFLLEYLKKDIREYYEIVVIRGQWDSRLSAPISNAYQELLKTSEMITAFDENFSEEGSMGMKIKTLLPKTAHDASAESIINRVVSDANDEARGYIITSTQNLVVIAKTIKQLLEDFSKEKHLIVQNWKELEKFFEVPFKDFSVNIYKKIYLFVQLMQNYIVE